MNAKRFITKLVGNVFFTVYFEKANGEMRRLTGRLGVKRHLRGGKRKGGAHLVTVWDCAKRDYRSFDPARVAWVKCWGMKIDFVK